MPPIRTSGGLVVTKAGLPACSCCEEACDCEFDELQVCWQYYFLDPDDGVTTLGPYCLVLNGSLCSSPPQFTGIETLYGSGGTPFVGSWRLHWDPVGTVWIMEQNSDLLNIEESTGGSSVRCDPAGSYIEDDSPSSWEGTIVVGDCFGCCGLSGAYSFGHTESGGATAYRTFVPDPPYKIDAWDYWYPEFDIEVVNFSVCGILYMDFNITWGSPSTGQTIEIVVDGGAPTILDPTSNPTSYLLNFVDSEAHSIQITIDPNYPTTEDVRLDVWDVG